MNKEILTQEKLKELLHYDPETGVFAWKTTRNGRVKIGSEAGVIGKNHYVYYRRIKILGKNYRAHRLAFLYMTGDFPVNQVDHDDGDGLNNKWSNLNDVSHGGNMRNQSRQKNNKSGCMGICFDKEKNRWLVQIWTGGREIKVGRFSELWLAICARKSAENKYGYHVNHGRVQQENEFCGFDGAQKVIHPSLNLHKNNKSGFKGVSFDKEHKKWAASIRLDGKQKRLGRFAEIWDAACSRKSAEYKNGFYDKYNRTNEI